jgi:hypothetical protein
MIIVSFPNGTDWYKANWVFRQLVQDVVEIYPADKELKKLMEQAQAFGTLAISSLPKDTASRTLLAIRAVIERTIKGETNGWSRTKPDDIEGQRLYLNALVELLDLIKEQMGK